MPQDRQDRQVSLDAWEKMTFERYGVPENLRRSILGQESADGTRLTSPTGVKGRYQVTQDTAKIYNLDRNDPWQQPVAAAKHLRSLYDGVKKRNPGFSDKQAWLGASAEYYYGADAFDKDGNLSAGSRDGHSTPAKYATSIAEKWSAFDRNETPQDTQPVMMGALPQYDSQGRRKIGARDVGITPAEGMRFDLSGGASRTTPKPTPRGVPQIPSGQRKLSSVGPRVGAQPTPGSFEEARANASRLTSQISPEAAALRANQTPGTLRDMANRFLKSAVSSAADISTGLARFPIGLEPEALYAMQAEAERTGEPNFGSRFATREGRTGLVAEAAKQAAETKAEAARRYPTDPNVQPSYNPLKRGFYQATLPEAAGSLAIPAATGVLAGPMAPLISGTIGALQGQGSTYTEAKEAGATDEEAKAAADIGALIGTTEAFGFGKILSRLGLARPALKRVKEIASEYGQETAAAWLGNLNASVLSGYDPSRSLNPLDPSVQGPGLVGAVLGGAVQGVDVGAQRIARQRSAPAPAQTVTSQQSDLAAALLAQPQESAPRAVRPGTEEITPEFRARSQRQALELMGMSPSQIEVEMQRRAPSPAGPSGQTALPPEPVREPVPQPVEQPAPPQKSLYITEQRAQERARLYEVSRNVSGRSMDAAQAAIDTGDFAEAQAQIAAGQRALRDALRFAPADAPGERARLAREVTRAGAMLTDAKRQAMAQRRLENQPTRGITAPRPQPSAQPVEQPQARASSPLLGSVVNPEGGVPRAPESLSGRFGALARRQVAAAEASPQPRRKDTGQLSPIEYLKRKTRGQGIRVSDRGEAAVLGAKEAGIVGLTNRRSRWTANDAAVMLDEGGFMLADGRRFTDGSVKESDVLDFLGASGKQGRMGTSALERKLADEEAEYYARFEEAEAEPTPRRPSETGALEEVGDFFGEMAEADRATGRQDDRALATAYRKLGTDDPEIISQLLRDADKRFKKSATSEEMDAAQAAWSRVQRLTPDEQRALSQTIQPRTFAPVRGEYQGAPRETYSRSIEDIPRSEPNAQLDKNLDDLLSFFDDVKDKPKPQTVQDAAQRLKDAASGKRAGSGAEQLVDLTIVAGWKAYRAGEDFATWSRDVIRQVGEQVRPHLGRVWKELTESFSVGPLPRTRADVERSPQFQRFFRGSKVVDKTGKPLVVYHGTPGSFETFDKSKIKQGGSLGPGFYIAENPHEAFQYIRGYNVGDDVSKTPNIMPLYLSMRKPLDVEAPLLDRAKVARLIPEDAEYLPDTDKVSYFEVIDAVGDVTSQDVAKKLGYDGLVIKSSAGRVWVAFEPMQIKSATGNRGAFESSNASILGGGLGSLQGMFEGGRRKATEDAKEGPGLRGRASETIGGLQTAAQLGNPRFVIRNVLQHVAYGKQERGAMRLAAALDWAISNVTGKGRQVTAPRGSDLAAYVRNWGKAIDAYKKGEPLPGKPNVDYLTADGNALDKAVGKVMTYINEIPDAANWQTRFEGSLQSIVKASKRSGRQLDVDDAVDQAWFEANRAAFRDSNFISKSLNSIKKALNTASSPIFGTDKFGAGDFILKYTQTPGALLRRGLERSPLGLFDVAKEAATPGPFRRRNTLLALSRVMTGTAETVGLGAALAAAGVLVGPEEDDRTGAALEREEGVRGYSLNASALRRLLTGESTKMQKGDQLYSIDWLQPWAMGASAGAALYNLYWDGKLGASSAAGETGKAVYDSLAKTLDIMGDQSVLKSLSRHMGRATGETFTDKTLSFAKSVGLDVPSSFVPSAARQARQVADPFERDTRPEQRAGVRGFASEAANRALSQLPGVSQTFPTRPSLLTGRDKKTALGEYSVPARIAAQFSPANISTYAPEPVAREISRLKRAGERVVVTFPRPLGEKQTGERGYRESTKSLRERERQFAEDFSTMSQDMIESPIYEMADDVTKAKALKALATHLRERTYKATTPKTIYDFFPNSGAPSIRLGRSNLSPQFQR